MRRETISVCAFGASHVLTHSTPSARERDSQTKLFPNVAACKRPVHQPMNIKYFLPMSRQPVNVRPLKKFKYLTLGKGKR